MLAKLDPSEGMRSARSARWQAHSHNVRDKTARVWDAITGRMVATLDPPEGLLTRSFTGRHTIVRCQQTRLRVCGMQSPARRWPRFAGVSASGSTRPATGVRSSAGRHSHRHYLR